MNEQWREIIITTSRLAADAISDKLIELGSQGTVFEDHVTDPERCRIKAYYAQSLDIKPLITQIEEYLEILQANGIPVGKTKIVSEVIESVDWSSNWKQYFKPLRVGEHFVIKPSWESFECQSEDIVVEIDPGMAFGTGLHASTRLMLMLLEHYMRPENMVLDVGVGSGILSIAAAHLGARYVLGVDIDAEAVDIARENVRKNARVSSQQETLEKRIELQVGSLDTLTISRKFDCIMMNIRPNIILPLFSYATAYLQTGGALMISGILEEEGPELINQLKEFDFIVQDHVVEDGWIAYVLSEISNE